MTEYLPLLTHSYAKQCETGIITEPDSRLVFLGEQIFQFTTYDDDLTEDLARAAITVVDAINEKQTYRLVDDPALYVTYIVMINMPFFAGRLDWGTSIRGAWWTRDPIVFESTGLWVGNTQTYQPKTYSPDEWLAFMRAVVRFAEIA